MQNAVTLELIARIHPETEPEHQVWWVHEPGAHTNHEPVPAVCLLPFWQLIARLIKDVSRRLESDRAERGKPTQNLEGVGLLDADDVAWLRTEGMLVISADSGLLAIEKVLDRLVDVQPGLVEIAEQWRAWLSYARTVWVPGSRFELRWGALFTEGSVFERVVSYRVFDTARFLLTCEGASAAAALRADMGMLLISVGMLPSDDNPDAQRLTALRRAVTHNQLGTFLELVDPDSEADARLIGPAFSAAAAADPQQRTALMVQRAELASTSPFGETRLRALSDAVAAIHDDVSGDGPASCVLRYRQLLDLYSADFLEDNEFLDVWLLLLANASGLLLTDLDDPRAALDLLLPRLQAVDSRPATPRRHAAGPARDLARARSYMDAAVAKLQELGFPTPVGIGTTLSTTDRTRLEQASTEYSQALAAPDPSKAMSIAEWALSFLSDRGVGSTTLGYTEWLIDWARAVRDNGDVERAATTLRHVVDVCDQANIMSMRTAAGRAYVALGVTYKRMERTDDEIAAYRAFLESPEASEPTRPVQLQVLLAHANLADALSRGGQPLRAVSHYLAASQAADRLGDDERKRVTLSKAADSARIGGDAARERRIRASISVVNDNDSAEKNDADERRGIRGWLRGRH